MEVGPAHEVELSALGALARRCGYASYAEPELRAARARGAVLHRIRNAERPLGFALYEGLRPEAELHLVLVEPEARGGGLGRQLLRHGFEVLRELGFDTLFLEVAESNPARRLYGRLGFEAQGRRKSYYPNGDDAWVLRRPLSP